MKYSFDLIHNILPHLNKNSFHSLIRKTKKTTNKFNLFLLQNSNRIIINQMNKFLISYILRLPKLHLTDTKSPSQKRLARMKWKFKSLSI
jgi:hypothetical protein